jgi:hypothetical protein
MNPLDLVSDRMLMYSFKKLALRHHPLKNPAAMNINLQKFHEICEAYEVLSDCNFHIRRCVVDDVNSEVQDYL